MWLATKYGFFSVVCKAEGDAALWHVRGRVREDLENLKLEAGLRCEVSESDRADYRYRLVVGKVGLVRVMLALAAGVDYPNFKAEVGALPDQEEKLPIYERWWADMLALQEPSCGRWDGPSFGAALEDEYEDLFWPDEGGGFFEEEDRAGRVPVRTAPGHADGSFTHPEPAGRPEEAGG